VTESLEHYDWAELIPVVLIYTFVFVLGICGNGIVTTHCSLSYINRPLYITFPEFEYLVLIIFTIARYRRFKNITNIFLASLSSADLLLVTVCIPVNVSFLISMYTTYANNADA